ncbi:MAG: hypothetical protein S4CHLAM45_04030 [Chlamydiales bacterium]|nr:hypothetical protein [Chlamydiales bacterium]MCH9619257.1 hypothetical protein [Chlamydiales bacterium]MCH9622519.1 hypothetical protein [Chlamydiales bacterium]
MGRRVDKCGSFIKGAVLGGIALGTAALLFAPKSGKKLRREIKGKANHVKEDAKEVYEDLCKHSKGFAQDTKKTAKKLAREFKRK